MQSWRYEDPFSCYILDISTRDPQLTQALNALPTYAFHPEMDQILELFQKMTRVDTRQTLDSKLEIWNYANSILRLLLRQEYSVAHTYEGNPRRYQAVLLAAKKYLEQHLEEDVDLKKLAADSHLHPTYFHKLFTAAFGRTPAEYLMWYRVLIAREYLRDDNCPISEIAAKCGFSSPSYFCQKFKQHSACSPSKYRRNIRNRRQK
jgi:AraC-like DNA-binding protein